MTNKQLYDAYHERDITPALKAYRLKLLTDRANVGNSEAQKYVDKIERASCAT